MQSFPTLFLFVLRAAILAAKMVTFSARNTAYTKLANFDSQGYTFCVLQHFATKFCSFANFKMFFPAVVKHFSFLDQNLVHYVYCLLEGESSGIQ